MMETILDPVKIERVLEKEGIAGIGLECSKMFLELAKAERSFSLFLDYVDDKKSAEMFKEKFEYLRNDCIVEAVKKTMICCY